MGFRARYDAFDRFQQRHAWLGFPLALRQKDSDDQGGYLAATITYYGFFSIFPLLLVGTTAQRAQVEARRQDEAVDVEIPAVVEPSQTRREQ